MTEYTPQQILDIVCQYAENPDRHLKNGEALEAMRGTIQQTLRIDDEIMPNVIVFGSILHSFAELIHLGFSGPSLDRINRAWSDALNRTLDNYRIKKGVERGKLDTALGIGPVVTAEGPVDESVLKAAHYDLLRENLVEISKENTAILNPGYKPDLREGPPIPKYPPPQQPFLRLVRPSPPDASYNQIRPDVEGKEDLYPFREDDGIDEPSP